MRKDVTVDHVPILNKDLQPKQTEISTSKHLSSEKCFLLFKRPHTSQKQMGGKMHFSGCSSHYPPVQQELLSLGMQQCSSRAVHVQGESQFLHWVLLHPSSQEPVLWHEAAAREHHSCCWRLLPSFPTQNLSWQPQQEKHFLLHPQEAKTTPRWAQISFRAAVLIHSGVGAKDAL